MKQMVLVVGGEASCGGAEDGVVDGAQGKAEGDEGSGGAEVVVGVGDKDDYKLKHFVGQAHGSHAQADGGSSSHGFPTMLVSALAFVRSAILAAATFRALACKHASVGEVQSGTNWDPVWTGPNPAVPVPVWDFPKIPGPLGLRSGHSHIARDHLRPGLDRDRVTYISNMLILYF